MNTQAQHTKNQENKIGLSTKIFRLILKKTRIQQLFKTEITDPRRGQYDYSVSSLLSCGLLVYLLRCGSRHAFHDQAKAPGWFATNIAKAIGASSMPSAKTLEDLFLQLDPSELSAILPHLFKQLIKSKFFQLHPECTLANHIVISIDGFISHTYYPHNQHPTESCLYCLKRQRGNTVWFQHMDVILSVIGPHGFKFPLFLYRVKGCPNWGHLSEEDLKQECELVALKHLLKQLYAFFPRTRFTILADSLYACRTIMELAEHYGFNYNVVRKEGSLRSLNDEIDGLKDLQPPLKREFEKGRWQVQQTAYLFDGLFHQSHPLRIINLHEEQYKLPSKRFAKVTQKSSHWQWIFREKIDPSNVFHKVDEARLRWMQEDQFNTLTNRGFAAKHDMSRAPHSQTIWKLLMLIAHALSMLMELSREGQLARGSMSIRNWIRDLWAELAKVSPEFLWNLPLPKQLRFFFDTS